MGIEAPMGRSRPSIFQFKIEIVACILTITRESKVKIQASEIPKHKIGNSIWWKLP